jgi:hypothetical protein
VVDAEPAVLLVVYGVAFSILGNAFDYFTVGCSSACV